MERSLGPVMERLNEWTAAAAPFLAELIRTAEAAAETAARIQPVSALAVRADLSTGSRR